MFNHGNASKTVYHCVDTNIHNRGGHFGQTHIEGIYWYFIYIIMIDTVDVHTHTRT